MRRTVTFVGVIAMLVAAAPASARGTRAAFGPLLGYTFDPGAPAAGETVPSMPQPDWWQLPTFNILFGPTSPPMFSPGSGRYESVALGNDSGGNARVYVSSSTTRKVYVYDAQMPINLGGTASPPQPLSTFGTQAGPGTLQDPAGLSYYKGEVYVVDRYHPNPGQDRVVVYDSDGNYNREFPLLNPRGLFDMTGIDVSGHEAWVTGELCGGFGGIVEIFDADTGALKGIIPHIGHAPTGSTVSPCTADADPSSWWDMATVPELNAAVAQYRLIFRGLLAQLSTPDAELTCVSCFRHLWLDGVDAVWGMRWLMAVDGATGARGSTITEYGIDEDPTVGTPFLQERRRWQPRQANSGGVRDVAYLNRDTRIDWQGDLTGHDWLRGSKCLQYVVSDGDIFAVGRQGEHWYELARGFQKIEFFVDGALKATQTTNPASYCLNTATVASGVHNLTAKATVAGGAKVVTITNDDLRLDNTLPRGSVDALARFIRGTQHVTGTGADDHSGLNGWTLQAFGGGSSSWRDLCGFASADLTGAFACDWQTDTGAWPDGTYRLHAHVGDRSSDGGNQNDSPEVTTYVDNTPPGLSVGGPLRAATDYEPLHEGEPVTATIDASDAGAGVTAYDLSIDGVSRDSANQGCAGGGCALSRSFTVNPEDYADGDHTVVVTVTDGVGNARSDSWHIDVERDTPTDGDFGEEDTTAASTTRSALPDPPQAPVEPNEVLPCTAPGTPTNFAIFNLGDSFEGLPQTARLRRCDTPYPGEPMRANFVSYIYGTCAIDPNDDDETGCTPPVEVQSWPACERTLSDYQLGPGLGPLPHENLTLRGVPAAKFDDGLRLELYTAGSTVVFFGHDPAQILRAAQALRPVLTEDTTLLPALDPVTDQLPQPVKGAVDGLLSCAG